MTAPAGIARTTINQSDLAKAFAVDCVTTYLTASSAQGTDLGRCFPDTTKMPIPTTPALIVSAPVAYATIQGSAEQDFTTYGVIGQHLRVTARLADLGRP